MINELSILDDIFNGADVDFPVFSCASFSPDVDVVQTKDAYTISMDLPGMSENDVTIDLHEGILTIASQKTEAKTEEKSEENVPAEQQSCEPVYLLRERRSMQFSRSFKLPRDTNRNEISAAFKNGVLEVKIPRKEAEQPKRIAISVA